MFSQHKSLYFTVKKIVDYTGRNNNMTSTTKKSVTFSKYDVADYIIDKEDVLAFLKVAHEEAMGGKA